MLTLSDLQLDGLGGYAKERKLSAWTLVLPPIPANRWNVVSDSL
jgi:hypothetical protein